MAASRNIVRRYLLAKVMAAPHRKRVALNTGLALPTLWYSNANGDKWVPDEKYDPFTPPPEGFIYQHSRFPRSLVENVLRLVTREAVDNCKHEEVLIDHGLIAGLEGRICRSCGGSQTKPIGTPWPPTWAASGSQNAYRAESSYPVSLVLAMTRPSPAEMQTAADRGHFIAPISFERAVLIAASSCERCMNVLMYRHGLDDGYEEYSDDWVRSNTRCAMCEG